LGIYKYFCSRDYSIITLIFCLKENNFQNIEIKETLERYWIIKENILRPKNEMVGHTGFIVSGRFIL